MSATGINSRFNQLKSGAADNKPHTFASIDNVIKARTPRALNAIDSGRDVFNRQSTLAMQEYRNELKPLAGYAAENEINDLTGLNGDRAQNAAINGISVTGYDQELQRRQRETVNRQAFASGDVGGASMQQSINLAGNQYWDNINGRINELSPLAGINRQARSGISSTREAGFTNMAAQDMAGGTQRANVRLGGVAPLIQNNLQQAQMRGLEGIGDANARADMSSQLMNAAGQFAGSRTPANNYPSAAEAYQGFQNPYYNDAYYQPSDTASGNYTTDYSGYA